MFFMVLIVLSLVTSDWVVLFILFFATFGRIFLSVSVATAPTGICFGNYHVPGGGCHMLVSLSTFHAHGAFYLRLHFIFFTTFYGTFYLHSIVYSRLFNNCCPFFLFVSTNKRLLQSVNQL